MSGDFFRSFYFLFSVCAVTQVVGNDFISINSNEQHKKGSVQRRLITANVPPKIRCRCDCVEYASTVLMKEEKRKKNKQTSALILWCVKKRWFHIVNIKPFNGRLRPRSASTIQFIMMNTSSWRWRFSVVIFPSLYSHRLLVYQSVDDRIKYVQKARLNFFSLKCL